MNNLRTILVAIKIVLSVLLLWLIVMAGKMGYANLHFWSADNQLSKWSREDKVDSEASYRKTLSAIEIATAYHPGNPRYLITTGLIQEWAVFGDISIGKEAREDYLNALENYSKAIQLRPYWPWAWGSMLMTKWRLNELDDELVQSLYMLDKYGPYTAATHYVIVDLGLTLITEKTKYAQEIEPLVKKHYQRGLSNPQAVKTLKDITSYYEADELLASWASSFVKE